MAFASFSKTERTPAQHNQSINEAQVSDQSTNLDDLNEEAWPSQHSVRVDSQFSRLRIGNSRATESESETIASMPSSSSSTSSRRASILRDLLEKNRRLTRQIVEMKGPAQFLTQKEVECAANPLCQEEPVVLKSASTKSSDDTKVELMTVLTHDMGVDTVSLNNTTMGMANTSPMDYNADSGLLDRNPGIVEIKDELISPEQLKFTEAIFKAMSEDLAPLIANRDQSAVRVTAYRG